MNKDNLVQNMLMGVICTLFGLGIAVSTALMSFSYVVLAVLVLFLPLRYQISGAFKNKYVLACFIFFILLLIGMLWSDVSFHDRYKMITRSIEYGLIPLFFIGLKVNNSAKYLLRAFVIGAILSALCSVLAYVFKYPVFQGRHDTVFYWTVFRGHLLHDVFLAVASNFMLWKILDFNNIKSYSRFWYLAAYILCLVDIMFLVQGRTGEIMMLVMNLVVILFRFGWRGIIYGLIALVIVVPLLLKFSPVVRDGIASYQNDQVQLQEGNADTSTGLRRQFHANALLLIKQRPFFGFGTGSFNSHYRELVKGTSQIATSNPHGDWYLIAVELGILGVVFFAVVIISNLAILLKTNSETRAMGFALLIGYLVAATQNSFFLDNVTGFAYVFLMLSILQANKLNA